MIKKKVQKSTELLSSKLISWYQGAARDLPWRRTKDPYHIWVSEIILQQTTVAQGEDYYHKFLKKFPSISVLAAASQEEVMKAWEGLGYYSRARNIHHAAQDIMTRFDGQFPESYKDIISLKGIGPYAAAAIGSFVFGIPKVVVDGNVLRVISRLYGIQEAVDTPPTKKQITELAQALQDTQDPAEFNQAIMEFGALNCTYKKPSCEACPLQEHCVAYKKNIVQLLPIKSKKIKKKTRYFQFLVLEDKASNFLVELRIGKDVWQGLHQFPLNEVDKKVHASSVHDFSDIVPQKAQLVSVSDEYKQTLTHQYIRAVFYHYRLSTSLTIKKQPQKIVVSLSKINDLAWPKIIANYLTDKGLL